MLTRKTLGRVPEFRLARAGIREWAEKYGPGSVRAFLDGGRLPNDPDIIEWVSSSPNPGTRYHRQRALYVALEEWEDEQRVLSGADSET